MYKRYYDIDVDAKAYANRIVKAGGRIPSDIGSVSDFIRKLKINNVWGQCIFWSLRSNQNIGAGNILYSAGNVKAYDGTISNGTWTDGGIYFNGTNSSIGFSNFLKNSTLSDFGIFACADFTQLATSGAIATTRNFFCSGTDYGIALGASAVSSGRIMVYDRTTCFAQNSSATKNYHTLSALSNGNNTVQSFNSTDLASNAPKITTPLDLELNIGAMFNGSQQWWLGRIAFVLVSFSPINNNLIRSLYISTIGKGLGLS
jgi:hypothetical protein